MKNYGINIEKEISEQSETDWKFGSTSPKCASGLPDSEVEKYLPKGELQRSEKGDMMDCATRSPNNTLETKLNYLFKTGKLGKNAEWLIDNGYVNENGDIELADAFTAILSGTTEQGNSLKAPIQAIHDYGFVPKSKLPLESWMTQKDYLNPERITPELRKLGEESKKRFPVNYDKTNDMNVSEVCTAGYAWPEPVNGEYPRVDSQFNHAFWKFRNPPHYIFDNYIDSVDGDFIKKLTPDYKLFDYGYRVYFSSINEIQDSRSFLDFIKEIICSISKLLGF